MKERNVLFLFLIFGVILSIILGSASKDTWDTNKILDLTLEYNIGTQVYLIRAFKSSQNDVILGSNKTNTFGQLEWFSFGLPVFVNATRGQSSFSFKNVFEIDIDRIRTEMHSFIQV